jgi:hypothetical protein
MLENFGGNPSHSLEEITTPQDMAGISQSLMIRKNQRGQPHILSPLVCIRVVASVQLHHCLELRVWQGLADED